MGIIIVLMQSEARNRLHASLYISPVIISNHTLGCRLFSVSRDQYRGRLMILMLSRARGLSFVRLRQFDTIDSSALYA